MTKLAAQHITKRFGERLVLNDVSFTITPGSVSLLAGRSGSGKSTLMSILAGLQTPSKGKVLIDERSLGDLDEDERARYRLQHLGIVFQDFQLIPDLTVEENVRLPLKLNGTRTAAAKDRALLLLQRLAMHDHAHDFPETLSGGEQQRVAIARALANDPPVVLADEPTANLDEENAHNVLHLLHQVAQDGRAVLIASHDPLAEAYAHVRFLIRDGTISMQRKTPATPNAAQVPA